MPGVSPESPGFWDARAKRYPTLASGVPDLLVRRVARAAGRRGSVIDVGAGPGRHALPLAARVAAVTAVDSSPGMLAVLGREARRRDITNLTLVKARWGEVEVAPAEVVLASNVVPLVAEAGTFLAAMDRAATRRAFVSMNAVSTDSLVDPIWRH
ncbi:MAG: class I SAM-dependent methyltransferase, partial [Acidimicrobiales bacterium]